MFCFQRRLFVSKRICCLHLEMRVEMEIENLKEKLDQSHTELKRTQAELRLHKNKYENSHVEHKLMNKKVLLKNLKHTDTSIIH